MLRWRMAWRDLELKRSKYRGNLTYYVKEDGSAWFVVGVSSDLEFIIWEKWWPQNRLNLHKARLDHHCQISVRMAFLSLKKYKWMFIDPLSWRQFSEIDGSIQIRMPIVKEDNNGK